VAAARRAEPGTAAQCWEQVLEACADADLRTQAYFNLGQVCRRSGNLGAAIDCFRQALAEGDANHEAREQLALILARSGAVDGAIGELKTLVQAQPLARHHFNLGMLLARQGNLAAAETAYAGGLEVLIRDAPGFANIGVLLADSEMDEAAVRCLAQAATARGDALAGALQQAGNSLDAAAVFLERAVAAAPGDPMQHYHLAALRVEQRRLDEAEAGFRRALSMDPACHTAAIALAHVLLGQGATLEGWRLHEARFERLDRSAKFVRTAPPTPRWRGEPIRGKVLLLRQEQGFGDEIQFIRYLPRLQAMGASRILIQCHAALCPLFANVPGLEVVAQEAVVPSHDLWISTMSLPLHCGGDIPAQLPYLHAPPAALARWRNVLGLSPDNLRVGLLWQGNRFHINDAHRSLASLDTLAPLWAIEGVEFISLQREPVETALPLRQFGAGIADFAEAAGLIAQLDLVVSVDSAYAHLAGALGKAVWTLLPASETDWRWGYAGDSTPWYPGMRLFRQARRDDWGGVVVSVAAALRALKT
ncbi:MAG TPA: tetratricopeptide repeat protein, partial [Rhodocyclaceae bacterium]|nr:tetratricopeptide repeat protein [Rhodocyclaceae bacterium]